MSVIQEPTGPGFLIRAIWFVAIGWWASGIASAIGWVIGLTIIGLPLTFWIFNRIPTVLTLRPRRVAITTTVGGDGTVTMVRTTQPSPAFWKRALYFVCVGWWFSAIWIVAAWLLSVLIVTLPFAVMMYNRLPAVTTLHRY